MTRVTNFGIKRTFLQAGFSDTVDVPAAETPAAPAPNESEALPVPPPKKKRKRTKMSQRDGNKAKNAALQEGAVEGAAAETDVHTEPTPAAQSIKPTKKSKPKTKKAKTPYVSPSEARRLKRIEERNATTTCFACRLKGHSARDCPSSQSGDKSKSAVGICYRCGSTKHTLSRCKKPADPSNPLPFASCFVCSGTGHLASACAQNTAKGIYPNGGCCKLCGETSHLAKDCGIRKRDLTEDSATLGMGREAGADEDDFHILKRRKTEVDRDEKQEVRMKRAVDVKVAAHSGVVKPFGNVVKPKKVVFF
ncbi:hypothetical protein DFH08DRAFT_782044 [Mycena albidolilacea]|uniref:CCHC-type domain-containing protein n=1 Tax=Mycena albidolilacea TaxID=1033008 RepID=A0AAD6ZX79_9AGAR|nr:hypothetical protein DFH08DRAFT_782044 [Mycena albidolilacea]